MGTSGSGPASMRRCAASSSGRPTSTPSTTGVTSSRTNRLDRSGWRHSGFKCITSARALVHFGALREQVAEPDVGHELGRLGLVHPPPQLLVTLETGEVARLGEAAGGGRGDCVGHGTNLALPIARARGLRVACDMPPAVVIALLILATLLVIVVLRRPAPEGGAA